MSITVGISTQEYLVGRYQSCLHIASKHATARDGDSRPLYLPLGGQAEGSSILSVKSIKRES